MKNSIRICASLIALFLFYGCDQGIDSLTQVDPGTDATAPQVKINYPTDGVKIKVLEGVTSITIDFEVTDDIEIAKVDVTLDGGKIGTYSNFKDYRRLLVKDLVYDTLTDGSHELSVTATDMEGKTTVVSVNFEKEPAYTPLFAGETFYMPFDGDYFDLVGLKQAAKVGTPGFAGEGLIGTNAYKGAADAYLTYPTDGLLGTEFTAAFWYKVDASPDRAGILVIGDDADDRNQGIRLFREGSSTNQTIKANVGTGTGESWNDGGVLEVTTGEWVHIALSISATQSTIFFNGVAVRTAALSAPVDWTGCDALTIGSGGATFSYWDHKSDSSLMDDLRLFNTALTEADIQNMINVTNPYTGEFDGEMFYLSFDGDTKNKFTNAEATVIGAPGFAGEGVRGTDAYAGAADSYLTFPTSGLTTTEFSATFWYNLNAAPDRAGILVMGPADLERPEYPTVQNLRTSGFRFFREGNATNQTFKLNVGNGTADTWVDGGPAASLDPTTSGWVHMAFTIGNGKAIVYFDGEIVKESDVSGVDWTGCDLLSIGSGAPRFTEWGHSSDASFMDELRLYRKALSQEEIQSIRNSDL
ncbi:Concanavalin A-like lectin/glucanases superfamily protein [Arenibacter nanhaiticus]|uniref:Concanavalin A-like lectin/glucanases superfamily protein n=1 Tax=Arenibacter nanhaiticus TaxID=558155 RepID=A0A1M6IWL5_9FLAO|nr:LamG-like jellyroll fold domain-containing protein [Arenibacter nanhaiticus]SHJ38843.1 Concanavalin A-like lectin/glucanases superfamily protein [Arenibacter nanhaiticus]